MSKRILVAGTHSGSGKTTLTLALLSAMKKSGISVTSFKCGPDFIDPQFHREIAGVPGRNLDPYMLSPEMLRASLAEADTQMSLIEGVMGYYDGVGMEGDYSTYDVAHHTRTPVILVVQAKGMYTSAAAIIKGFTEFREESMIRGVIFNGISEGVYHGLSEMAKRQGVMPLGFLPQKEELKIASRHLGLLQSHEVHELKEKLALLGELALKHIDLEGVLALGQTAPDLSERMPTLVPLGKAKVAVASDEAFCFMYQENLRMLEELGARLVYFSPIRDRHLPEDVDALYLPGGYPELHLSSLAKNRSMHRSIKEQIERGLPVLAEGGGFAYLHEDFDGHKMVGVIRGSVTMSKRLQHFGYHTLTAHHDNLLCAKGESLRTHEYHYYVSDQEGESFIAEKPDGRSWNCVHASKKIFAGFAYVYFPQKPAMAESFVRAALNYKEKRKR